MGLHLPPAFSRCSVRRLAASTCACACSRNWGRCARNLVFAGCTWNCHFQFLANPVFPWQASSADGSQTSSSGIDAAPGVHAQELSAAGISPEMQLACQNLAKVACFLVFQSCCRSGRWNTGIIVQARQTSLINSRGAACRLFAGAWCHWIDRNSVQWRWKWFRHCGWLHQPYLLPLDENQSSKSATNCQILLGVEAEARSEKEPAVAPGLSQTCDQAKVVALNSCSPNVAKQLDKEQKPALRAPA